MTKEMNYGTLYSNIKIYKDSENNAIYFRNMSIQFKDFIAQVDEMAEKLSYLGVKKDTVVTLLSPNVPDTIRALYALSKIGAIYSIVHPLMPKDALMESLEQTKSEYLLILDARYGDYRDVLENTKYKIYFLSAIPDLSLIENIGFHIGFHKGLQGVDKQKYLYLMTEKKEVVENDDPFKPSIYLHSGGTTGKSKIVVLNENGIAFVCAHCLEIVQCKIEGNSMIGLLPIFHGFGLAMGVHAPLRENAATALMIHYSQREIISKIKKNKLNFLLAVPYMVKRLLNDRRFDGKMLENLYATYVGADQTPMELFDVYNERMSKNHSRNLLLEGYGLTETSTVNFVNTHSDHINGSVGKPLAGVELRIAKDGDLNRDAGPYVEGEIMVSSPSVCLYYLNTPISKQPFHYDNTGKKWLRTGDIGYHDENGYLYYKNRAKDVVKIAGYSIFPSDIEKAVNEVKQVSACAMVYINNATHPYFHLYVESLGDCDTIRQSVLTQLKDKFIKYAIPEKITVVKALPRTTIGKINKKELLAKE